MRIRFVNVRYDETQFRFRVNVLGPPLGMAYLASLVRAEGHDVKILDMEAVRMEYDQLPAYLAAENPDVVGIHGTTPTSKFIAQCARVARATCPRAVIVVGGPHASLLPWDLMRDVPEADYILRGEAEASFPALIRLLSDGDRTAGLREIPGIGYRTGDGGVFISPDLPKTENLEDLPFPAWDLLPLPAYLEGAYRRSMNIMTSRGCPQACVFSCESVLYGRRFRSRSAKSIVDEMERLLIDHGVERIHFYDASFMVDEQRVRALCDEILKRGLALPWRARARADHINRPIIERMKEAGCTELAIGVEAAAPELLRALNKNEDVGVIERAFEVLHDCGLWISAYFMFGAPGETRKQSYETIEFAKRLDPDWALFSHTTPLPGTRLYETHRDQLMTRDWYDFRLNANSPVLAYGGMEKAEIQEILLAAYRSFYVRREWVLNRLKKAKSQAETAQIIESFFFYIEKTDSVSSPQPMQVSPRLAPEEIELLDSVCAKR